MIVIHNIYPKRRIITAQWKRNFKTFNHKFRGDHSHESNADVPLLFVCIYVCLCEKRNETTTQISRITKDI